MAVPVQKLIAQSIMCRALSVPGRAKCNLVELSLNINSRPRSHMTKTFGHVQPTYCKRWSDRTTWQAVRLLHCSHCLQKGHAHWQNIAAVKNVQDAKYQMLTNTYVNKMREAIREEGPDPAKNKKLNIVMEQMKIKGIPKADIKRYYNRMITATDAYETQYVMLRGSQGVVFVMEAFTNNLRRVKDDLKHRLRKLPVQVMEGLAISALFDQKGVVRVPVTSDMYVVNMDPYVEVAVDVGAEDVICTPDENADNTVDDTQLVLKFHCDPLMLTRVAEDIEEIHNLKVSGSQVELIPTSWVILSSKEDLDTCAKVAEVVRANPDFVNIFDNITLPED